MNYFLSYARKSRRLFWRHAGARRFVLSWAAILIASAGCAIQPAPVNSVATFEIEVVNPDGTIQWRKMYRTVTEHYPLPNCGGNEEEDDGR